MCKDHDLQHYAIDLREIAREICGGDNTLASQLMDHATFDGLTSFMNVYDRYCEDARLERINTLIERGFTRRRHKAISLAGEVVNLWDTELGDLIPF